MYDQYVNETLSVDNGVCEAMCHHEFIIEQEELSQKFCDLINEVTKSNFKSHYFYYHTIVCIIFWASFAD